MNIFQEIRQKFGKELSKCPHKKCSAIAFKTQAVLVIFSTDKGAGNFRLFGWTLRLG